MRFPRWSPDGARLISELNGQIVLSDRGPVHGGWGGCWLQSSVYAYFDDRGVWDSNGVNLYPHRVSELHAGGGHWGARDGQGNLIIDGNIAHANAGQPFFDREGNWTANIGDGKREPTRWRHLYAWVEDPLIVVTSWGARFPGEGWPRLIPAGNITYLLTMGPNGALRVREGRNLKGWQVVNGNDGNLEPDGVFDTVLKVAYWNEAKHVPGLWQVPLHETPTDFDAVIIPAPTPPPVTPEPPMPTPPAVDLGAFGRRFLELVAGTNPADYRNVIARIQPELWTFGAGSQNRSSGEPSSRLFLPHAGCRDVSPRPGNALELKLGVRQERVAWESTVDTVWPPEDPAKPEQKPTMWLLHNAMGPAYLPLTSGDDGDPGDEDPPPPTAPDLTAVLRRLDALEMVDKAFNAELAELADIRERVTDIAAKLEKLATRTYRVNLSRDWGHSHRGTVESVE